MIGEIIGDDRCRDVWCSLLAVEARLMIPSPPFLAGNARSSLSMSLEAGYPLCRSFTSIMESQVVVHQMISV